jgi:acyl carrier protein
VESWDETFEAILRRRLTRIAADAPLRADLDLRGAGVDSLALVDLLVALEDAYDIEFPDNFLTADTFRTPGSLWTAVSALRTPLTTARPADRS